MSTTEPWEPQDTQTNVTAASPVIDSQNTAPPQSSVLGKKIYDAMQSDKAAYLSDVTIVSCDGFRFPAVRVILATMSPYFNKMFTSQFRERNQLDVDVSISSAPLREILEFIYTGDCMLIRLIRRNQRESTAVLCTMFRDLIHLARAADYLNVEKLLPICESVLTCSAQQHPHLACIILNEFDHGPIWTHKLCIMAKFNVIFRTRSALLSCYDGCDMSCGVMHFSADTARKVFEDVVERNCAHLIHDLFQALLIWATKGTSLRLRGKRRSMDDLPIVVHLDKLKYAEDRIKTANDIAAWFDLTHFKPRFLSDVFEESGLIEQDRINKTYKKLLLRYDESSNDASQTQHRKGRRRGSDNTLHRVSLDSSR